MLKEEFPILSQSVNEKPLIYLDNASTTQKPSSVINPLRYGYGSSKFLMQFITDLSCKTKPEKLIICSDSEKLFKSW